MEETLSFLVSQNTDQEALSLSTYENVVTNDTAGYSASHSELMGNFFSFDSPDHDSPLEETNVLEEAIVTTSDDEEDAFSSFRNGFSFKKEESDEQARSISPFSTSSTGSNASRSGNTNQHSNANATSPISPTETTSPSQMTTLLSNACLPSHGRHWKMIQLNGQVSSHSLTNLTVQQILEEINIEIRTRSEKPSTTMPERLYSSLKYELKQTLSLLFADSQVIMARVQVVNPQDSNEEIFKTNGQSLLKGLSDMTVLSRTNSGFESKVKIQFTDVSYHFENKHFALKISYFDPCHSIDDPIMTVLSSPFKVFARRPSSKKPFAPSSPISTNDSPNTNSTASNNDTIKTTSTTTTNKTTSTTSNATITQMNKRKLSSISQPTTKTGASKGPNADAKRQKVLSANTSRNTQSLLPSTTTTTTTTTATPFQSTPIELKKAATMKDFLDCLELLTAFKKTLSTDEQKVAMQITRQKLFHATQSHNDESYLA